MTPHSLSQKAPKGGRRVKHTQPMPHGVVRPVQRIDRDGSERRGRGHSVLPSAMLWERQHVRADTQKVIQTINRRRSTQAHAPSAEIVEHIAEAAFALGTATE